MATNKVGTSAVVSSENEIARLGDAWSRLTRGNSFLSLRDMHDMSHHLMLSRIRFPDGASPAVDLERDRIHVALQSNSGAQLSRLRASLRFVGWLWSWIGVSLIMVGLIGWALLRPFPVVLSMGSSVLGGVVAVIAFVRFFRSAYNLFPRAESKRGPVKLDGTPDMRFDRNKYYSGPHVPGKEDFISFAVSFVVLVLTSLWLFYIDSLSRLVLQEETWVFIEQFRGELVNVVIGSLVILAGTSLVAILVGLKPKAYRNLIGLPLAERLRILLVDFGYIFSFPVIIPIKIVALAKAGLEKRGRTVVVR
jgi:hypothetical protein